MSDPSQMNSEYLRRMGDPMQELQGCAPDFLFISPPKTGTTWLSQNLSCHPEIYIPAIKEISYFSIFCREFDINWYLRHFQSAGTRKKGDATPYAGLPLHAIESIRHLFPRLKLIFFMRDPIERAWSQTKHDYRFRQGTFGSYSGSLDEIPDEKFIQNFTALISVNVGDYLRCLRRWLSCFDRDQIFVGFFESIKSGPEELFRRVLRYLDVNSDVDLSDFPISERIFTGIEKEVPAHLKPYLKAIYAEKTRELGEFLKVEFQISPPSEWDSTIEADDHDPLLLEEDYKGYQLHLFRSKFYALPVQHGDVPFAKHSQLLKCNPSSGDYLAGNSLDEVKNYVDRGGSDPDPELYVAEAHVSYLDDLFSRPFLPLTSCFGFDVFLLRHRFYALSHRLFSADPALLREELLLEYQSAGMCYAGASLHEIQNILLELGTPVLVQESYQRFNIVQYQKKYYGVEQSLGSLDLTGLDQATLRIHEAAGQILTAGSLEEIRTEIEERAKEMTPTLILEGYEGFNVVSYRKRFFGFAQSLGPLNLAELDEETLGSYEASGQVVTASSLEEIRTAIEERAKEMTPTLILEGCEGFNVVSYRKRFYGFAQSLGPLNLAELDEETLGRYEGSGQVVTAGSLEEVRTAIEERAKEMTPTLVLEGYKGFNVVSYRKRFFGFAQSLGPLNLAELDEETLGTYEASGQVVMASSLEEIRTAIEERTKEMTPTLILEGYEGFNVVSYRKRFFGFAQSLGPLNLAELDEETLGRYEGSGQVVTASSLEEFRTAIEERTKEMIPTLILEGYEGFNVVSYRKRFYGFAQLLGPLNLVELDEGRLGRYEASGQVVIAGSLENVRAAIEEKSAEMIPTLVTEGYRGFNVVAYRKRFYGFALSLGPLNLTEVDEETLTLYEASGQVVTASSQKDVTESIDATIAETIPILVLEGYFGFNLLRYRKNYLGLAQSLGTVDLTTATQTTLDEYQAQGNCVIAASLDMAKNLIDQREVSERRI